MFVAAARVASLTVVMLAAGCGSEGGATNCTIRCEGSGVAYCDDSGTEGFIACPTSSGSTCGDIAGEPWCSCGSVPASGACYKDATAQVDLVACENGALAFYSCPPGTSCDTDANGAACFCDDAADGVCPDAECVDDPDCASCTPNCSGRECGDNGCGGTCLPGCAVGVTCQADGTCGGGGPASPWTQMVSGTTANLRSISGVPAIGSSPRRVITVGDGGVVLQLQATSVWGAFPTTGVNTANLRAVSVQRADTFAAVGQGGKAYVYAGIPASWKAVNTGIATDLDAVHQRANDTYIFGADAYRFMTGQSPPTVSDVYNGPSATFRGSSGFQNAALEDEVWAVGDNGVIVRLESVTARFLPETSGTAANLRAVFATREQSQVTVFAVGDGGVILRSSGDGSWTPETSCTSANLYGVFGSLGGSEVYAVGAGGVICKRTGTGWVTEPSGTTTTLRSGVYLIAGTGVERYIVGDGGTILKK